MRLVFGGGDLIEALEDALARVKSGELVGVAVIGIGEGGLGYSARVIPDTPAAWARMVAAVTDAQHDMIAKPVEEWP